MPRIAAFVFVALAPFFAGAESFTAAGEFSAGEFAAAATRTDPLPPEEVFIFSAEGGGGAARAVFSMPEDYYLYRQRFVITVETPGFAVTETRFSPAEAYDDPFFGVTEIYFGKATVRMKISGEGKYKLKIISQGCDKLLNICYPPQTHVAELDSGGAPLPPAEISSAAETAPAAGGDDTAAAAAALAGGNIWGVVAAFFGFGLLLSFTPCVLPMVPVLLGVIGGGGGRRRAAQLTAAYIGGVVAAYTVLGIAAGLSGRLLAPFLQQPPVLIASSAIFTALAFSMFGLYDIQAPAFLRRFGGRGGGAFAMGALSAAVVSPCVAAPLIGALVYIGNTGDAALGGLALFSLSLGMSATLAAAGIGGGEILPRAGAWTNDIKYLLGAMLLGAAAWVSASLLPAVLLMLIYGGLLIFCGVLLWGGGAAGGVVRRAAQSLGIAALLWGGAILLGAAGGGRDPLSPLSHFVSGGKRTAAPRFLPVHSLAELRRALAESPRPAVLEFYADWCVSCKEMERWTFSDSRVRARLQKMLLLRADVTANNEADRALLKEFGLYGPPAVLFFTADGGVSRARVNGYQSAD
ncbi:MAG: protein-disulfide reductase DsbD, partial [Betaproteobacteria bacterium]|nr:protein-disulfide reductase DsbD [Betaproteobacteria bacterium]